MNDKEQRRWQSTAHGLIVNEKKSEILLYRDDHQFYTPFVEIEGGYEG